MKLLRVDTSIRVAGSVSRSVADSLQRAWQDEHPAGTVVRRDLGAHPLPADAWTAAALAGMTPEYQRTSAHADAAALAARLADEALDADAYVVATSLYNFGVSQHLKTWIDLLIADPRLGPGSDRPLAGRPLTLVIARGGGYGPGTPREGWDHATPWLHRIFADVFGMDTRVVAAELTLADVNPAMAELRGLAAESLRHAHAAAAEHGQDMARRIGERASA
ncbi:FMN-dependent NADH-azoreductase [Gandjariella thermophila]|uniref:FMN dependent NADH:quinone oxidoreductase n=1 Tax=Gandjariella thermophila TaxID=1931992 RepID=A0A4D4JE10_9PSEU|nr:NAD(P)H-dependent oxidoreductase [Gandjariella thermophila]GDY32878.1 FMN-dependent NADH-azoreductase [Gandjariella thermophila]